MADRERGGDRFTSDNPQGNGSNEKA